MLLRPLTEGRVSGSGAADCSLLGPILISSDGTNAAVIVIRDGSETGPKIFDISTKIPGFWGDLAIRVPSGKIHYSISGTNAAAQLYEAVT